jgi:Zn-dependent protease
VPASELTETVLRFLPLVVALVIAITVHEFSHAFVAQAQGDLTAKQLGRVTLNPLKHLDPLGTLLIFVAGFGWGRPTPVNEANLRNGRHSMVLVSLAGIVANFATAILVGAFLRAGLLQELVTGRYIAADVEPAVRVFLRVILSLNIGLALFNFLPVAPLDGFSVLYNLVPKRVAGWLRPYRDAGPGVLMLIVFLPRLLPQLSSLDVLGILLGPASRLVERFIVGT